jgi:hypothetical protein
MCASYRHYMQTFFLLNCEDNQTSNLKYRRSLLNYVQFSQNHLDNIWKFVYSRMLHFKRYVSAVTSRSSQTGQYCFRPYAQSASRDQGVLIVSIWFTSAGSRGNPIGFIQKNKCKGQLTIKTQQRRCNKKPFGATTHNGLLQIPLNSFHKWILITTRQIGSWRNLYHVLNKLRKPQMILYCCTCDIVEFHLTE